MNSALFSVYCFAVCYFTLTYAVHSHGLDTTAQKQMKYGSYGKCSEEYTCENGGKCIDSFCKCKNGTSGDLCSVIDACEKEPKPCGYEECRYNVTEEKEYCHPSQWFHPEEKRRYDYCAENEDKCENGGICYKKDGKPICFCKEGTLGEECRTIQKCLTEFCGSHDEDVTCKFSVEKEQAFCECHDSLKGFHKLDKICKIKCDESSPCKNGGKCTGDPDSFCECKTGTSGDLCSTIDACTEDPHMCGFEAKCVYDAVKEDVFCECEDDSEWFDEKDKDCKRLL